MTNKTTDHRFSSHKGCSKWYSVRLRRQSWHCNRQMKGARTFLITSGLIVAHVTIVRLCFMSSMYLASFFCYMIRLGVLWRSKLSGVTSSGRAIHEIGSPQPIYPFGKILLIIAFTVRVLCAKHPSYRYIT